MEIYCLHSLLPFCRTCNRNRKLTCIFYKKDEYEVPLDSPRFFSGRNDLRIACRNICKSERCTCLRTWPYEWLLGDYCRIFRRNAANCIIDHLIPAIGNPHEVKSVEDVNAGPTNDEYAKLKKMGMFTALAIAIHNFPEGIATFTSALQDPTLGIAIAIAVAIHNIPEGIAVAVPIYFATGNRKQAFQVVFSFRIGRTGWRNCGLSYFDAVFKWYYVRCYFCGCCGYYGVHFNR